MHRTVGRHGFAAVQLKRPAVKIRDSSAGLFDEEDAGSGIPRIQIELPKSVEAPAGHAAQVQGGRSGAPDTVGLQRDLMIEKDVRILVALVAGKSRSHQTLREIRGF